MIKRQIVIDMENLNGLMIVMKLKIELNEGKLIISFTLFTHEKK